MEEQSFKDFPLLVVDDEKNFLNSLEFVLRSEGISQVEICCDSREVIARLSGKKYAAVLLDILMPHIRGDVLLPKIVELFPRIPVIIVTAFPEDKTAIDCMKKGAFDCHNKPVDTRELIRTIQDAWDLREINKEIIQLKKLLFTSGPNQQKSFPNFATCNKDLQSIWQNLEIVSFTSKPVLIWGEKGTGKEFLAREIHIQSRRRGEFVIVDTRGMDDETFSRKLFGYKKGAFAGAMTDHVGLLEKADGGTLYFNEIGSLAMESQSKLVSLLQEREYRSLGDDTPKQINIRIIAASEQNLSTLVKLGTFHPALYTRLSVAENYIPPLRDRKKDIPLFLHHFLEVAAEKYGITPPLHTPNHLLPLLEKYNFPGNIGELKQMVDKAVSRYKAELLPLDVFLIKILKIPGIDLELSDDIIYPEEIPMFDKIVFRGALPTFDEMEAIYIEEVMKRTGKDLKAAGFMSKLNQKALNYQLKKVQILKNKRSKKSK